jgi:hypothetical protein
MVSFFSESKGDALLLGKSMISVLSGPVEEALCCHKCPRKLYSYSDKVVLDCPCKHLLCPECAIVLLKDRKFSDVVCKSCCNVVSFINYERGAVSEEHLDGQDQVTRLELKKHEFNLYKEPFRCFEAEWREDPMEAATKAVLSLSIVDRNTFQPVSFVSTIDVDNGPESVEDEFSLRTIFSLLHPALAQRNEGKIPVSEMTEGDMVDYAAYKDDSLLLKLLYSLATGRVQIDSSSFDTDHCWRDGKLAELMACFVAKEMIARLHARGPLILQKVMAIALERSGATKDLREFLSRIRLAESPYARFHSREKANKERRHVFIDRDPLAALALNFDQIGFKQRNGSYKNHLVMQIQLDPTRELKLLGFYNDNRLSRTDGLSWNEVLGKHQHDTRAVAKSIVGVQEEDIKTLSRYTLTNLKCAIDIFDALPDIHDCREILRDGRQRSSNGNFPNNLGVELVEQSNYEEPESRLIGPRKDSANSRKLTFYQRNHIHLQVEHSDPAARDTIVAILDYMNNASNLSNRSWNNEVAGAERPIRDDFVFITCDNSPESIWWGIRNKDIQSHLNNPADRKYKRFRFVVGPFHAEAAFLCSRGRLSRDVVTPFLSLYRKTEPRINWVLSPHDTSDVKNENIEYILAHYTSAISACRASLQKQDVSPVEVHQYMVARAEKYPTVMAILLDLRLITIDFMIRDTEKSGDRGDLDLFLQSMRLSLVFFACTNATKYVRTVCEFLEWYYCASTAEKVLFRKYYFCKMTPNGRPIWGDRAVEKTMLHIRQFMGRYARPNHDNVLEKVVTDIPFRQEAMRNLRDLLGRERDKSYTTKPWNKQVRSVGKVFANIRVACEDWNVWGGGAPKHKGSTQGSAETHIILPDGKSLSNTYLSAKSIGEKRVLDFYETNLVKTRYPDKISFAEVSLRMLPTTTASRDADLKSLKIIRLSTNEIDFFSGKMENLMSRKRIAEEILWYDDVYYDVPKDFFTATGNLRARYDRKKLVELLCKFRKRYFNDFPGEYDRWQGEIDQLECDDVVSTRAERRNELKDAFYSLHQEVMDQFR